MAFHLTKKNMKKIIIFQIFVCFLLTVNAQTTITVGPGGMFSSIDAARIHIRSLPKTANITVNIEQETYQLSAPIQFTAEDSGNASCRIIYQANPGNTLPVIISGGTRLTGWTAENGMWEKAIDTVYTRQLYAQYNTGTIRGQRARSADNLGLVEFKEAYVSTCTAFTGYANPKDMEIVSNVWWRSHRIPVQSVSGKCIVVDRAFHKHITAQDEFTLAPAVYLENSLSLLDAENEWYLKRSATAGPNILYYKSNGNADPDSSNLSMIVPMCEALIKADSLEYVTFNNLQLSYTKWNKPSKLNTTVGNTTGNNYGFYTEQGDRMHIINGTYVDPITEQIPRTDVSEIPAVVSFTNSKNIIVSNNTFSHIGSTALAFGAGCKNNTIDRNTFTDISASAIRAGNYANGNNSDYTESATGTSFVENTTIKNNLISGIGKEFYGCIGILASVARNTTISNNTLSDFPHTGISLGYYWKNDIFMGTNRINNNRIDCSNVFIPDSGGIYTISVKGSTEIDSTATCATTPFVGTKIVNNYVYNHKYYRGPIYLDQYSSNMVVSNNFIDAASLTIPGTIDCKLNTVQPVDCWLQSKDVVVKGNFCSTPYVFGAAPPCDTCSRIYYSNNTQGTPNNNIKDCSGQNPVANCTTCN